jgi:cell division protease FtsH
MLYGGRVAEEMIFGPEKVTTGAGNDIERATQMARRMVTRFGMSDLVGLMAVGDSDHEVFLGREITQRRDVSEHTAQLVDQEVKRTLDQAHERARKIIEKERTLLESIAEALLERETLGREDVNLLAAGETLPPLPQVKKPSEEQGSAATPAEATAGVMSERQVGSEVDSAAAPASSPARLGIKAPDPDPTGG